MADAAGKKNVNAFSNEMVIERAIYDFAQDGGAVGVIDLMEMKDNMICVGASIHVISACTSDGSATVEIGVKGGDTDAVLAATAVGSLTLDAYFPNASAASSLYLASGAILSAEIKVAALTAGKIEVIGRFVKAL